MVMWLTSAPKIRPHGRVICYVCKRSEIVEGADCEEVAALWRAHPWLRENGIHTCNACWAGTKEAV
jgi:hypothetical protein